MARCDEGYLCEVCGEPVPEIIDSDLYLRYVIGEIDDNVLASAPERHIRCNPVQAQFIVDDGFDAVLVEGPFDKRELDQADVTRREKLVTQGWRRLQQLPALGIPITEYPLCHADPAPETPTDTTTDEAAG